MNERRGPGLAAPAHAAPGLAIEATALAWCLGIGVVSMAIAAVLFRRRTA